MPICALENPALISTTPSPALQDTQAWLEQAVIGLNLCPFAKAVHAKGQIRWVESSATQPRELLADLVAELKHLHAPNAALTS